MFFRGVYMNSMLIFGAAQKRITITKNMTIGFGHGDNCVYTDKFYSEAGIGIICRCFVPAFVIFK